ncbi:Fe-S cluster assembly protein SufB [Tardisphaera miroshnichenkoae]
MSEVEKAAVAGSLNEEVVRRVSQEKGEPDWMLKKRLYSLSVFENKPMPTWGADLSGLKLDDLAYYVEPGVKTTSDMNELPENLKRTFDALGIPEAERNFLAGNGAMYQSEVIYERIRDQLTKQGVIFMGMDEAVKKYPDLVQKYFMTRCVPPTYHKFAALNGAIWSGGTFLYVPKGVKVSMPVQVYFLVDHPSMGQFEHTVIVAEDDASVEYIEGCSAPMYVKGGLHAGIMEIFVGKRARVRVTTIQNWSKNIYNLVTKRAIVEEEGKMEWVEASLGSKVTMLYPASVLAGRGARAEHFYVSMAGDGQVLDTGAKIVHAAPDTSAYVLSRSISKGSGRAIYRGEVKVNPGAKGCSSSVKCDSLLISDESSTATFPTEEVYESDADVSHEATAGRIAEEQLFYLMSRGFSEEEARGLIVRGFMEPVTKKIPLEYAVEFNRIIDLEMKNSVA